MPKIDTTIISALNEQIEKLPERTTITTYELVKQVAPAIAAACDRGQDVKVIASLLRKMGVRLAPRTLRNHLSRARREVASRAPEVRQARILPTLVPALSTEPERRVSDNGVRSSRPSPAPAGGRFELVADKTDL